MKMLTRTTWILGAILVISLGSCGSNDPEVAIRFPDMQMTPLTHSWGSSAELGGVEYFAIDYLQEQDLANSYLLSSTNSEDSCSVRLSTENGSSDWVDGEKTSSSSDGFFPVTGGRLVEWPIPSPYDRFSGDTDTEPDGDQYVVETRIHGSDVVDAVNLVSGPSVSFDGYDESDMTAIARTRLSDGVPVEFDFVATLEGKGDALLTKTLTDYMLVQIETDMEQYESLTAQSSMALCGSLAS